jgi:hypothetical protein
VSRLTTVERLRDAAVVMKQVIVVSLLWPPMMALSSCGSSEPNDPDSKSQGGASVSGASGAGAMSGLGASSGARAGAGGAASGATGNSGGGGGVGSSSGVAAGGSQDAGGAGASAGKAGESGGDSTDAPDVPPETLLDDLDEAQKAVICDWNAELVGGYGHVDECGMGPRVFFADQAECTMYAFDWDCEWVTVQNFSECAVAQKASGGCNRPSEQCSWQLCR